MSGMLQRLALRALGRSAAIRPIAGLTVPAVRHASLPDADPFAGQYPFHSESDTVASGQSAATMKAPLQSIVPPAAIGHRHMVDEPASSLMAPALRGAARNLDVAIDNRVRSKWPSGAEAPEVSSSGADPLVSPNEADFGSIQKPITRPPDAQRQMRISESDQAYPRSGHPGPAFATRASARTAHPSSLERTCRTPGTAERPAEQVTEVHVTIGRIELTAAPTPALPRRAR
jgi:hypothetical protein